MKTQWTLKKRKRSRASQLASFNIALSRAKSLRSKSKASISTTELNLRISKTAFQGKTALIDLSYQMKRSASIFRKFGKAWENMIKNDSTNTEN